MNVRLSDALSSLRPTAEWSCGDTYESIIWFSQNITVPTQEEINTEIQRLQILYERNLYQRQRAIAYPTIEDQLDILYHQGYEGWRSAITAVKDQYPKPTE